MPRKAKNESTTISEEQPLLPIDAPQRPRSRLGKRTIAAHFDPAIHRAVSILSVNEDRTRAELLTEAILDLLRKYKVDMTQS